jgi:pimeloyl-ACP methyl ester carboxylesterase
MCPKSQNTKKPLVVFHGGPGLTSSYFASYLDFLAVRFEISYADKLIEQYGPSSVHTATDILNQVGARSPMGIFAHSWGAVTFLDALMTGQLRAPISWVVFCCPSALTRSEYEIAGKALLDRIPAEVLCEIDALERSPDPAAGTRIMQRALPYYCGSPQVPKLEFEYSPQEYAAIMDSKGDFDVQGGVSYLPAKIMVIYGTRDFADRSLTSALAAASATVVELPSGHFPFAEDPAGFQRAILSFLDSARP